MRTSLNEIKKTEQYLLKENPPEEALLFEAQMILDPRLKEKAEWQQKTYQLVRAYGRLQLRAEIEAVHQQLFTKPAYKSFRQKIRSFFNR